MRRYSSFVVRRWQLAATAERVEVEHLQSGQRATVDSLALAAQWMAAIDVQEGGGPILPRSLGEDQR